MSLEKLYKTLRAEYGGSCLSHRVLSDGGEELQVFNPNRREVTVLETRPDLTTVSMATEDAEELRKEIGRLNIQSPHNVGLGELIFYMLNDGLTGLSGPVEVSHTVEPGYELEFKAVLGPLLQNYSSSQGQTGERPGLP